MNLCSVSLVPMINYVNGKRFIVTDSKGRDCGFSRTKSRDGRPWRKSKWQKSDFFPRKKCFFQNLKISLVHLLKNLKWRFHRVGYTVRIPAWDFNPFFIIQPAPRPTLKMPTCWHYFLSCSRWIFRNQHFLELSLKPSNSLRFLDSMVLRVFSLQMESIGNRLQKLVIITKNPVSQLTR